MRLGFLEKILCKNVGQAATLSFANMFSLGFGFCVNIILATQLGVYGFGTYSFAYSVLSFVGLFMEFGLYSTAAKLLADNMDEKRERVLLGSIIIVYIIVNALFSAIIYVISFFIDDFFSDKIGALLKAVCFSGYAYTAPFFMEWVLKGCNRIKLLSFYLVLNKCLYLLLLVAIDINAALTPQNILHAYGISCGIAIFICYSRLKPLFVQCKDGMTFIINMNKKYGWPLFWGRIVDVGSVNLNRLLIAFFIDAKTVGLYNLAIAFVSVVSVFGRSIGITKFKTFAKEKFVHRDVFRSIYMVTIVSMLLVICVACMTVLYMGKEYYSVVPYLLITIWGTGAQSLYTPYNFWLNSHGYMYDLRNASFKLCILNSVLGIMFTYLFSAYGTAMVFTIGYIYAFYLYRKIYLKKQYKEC